MALRSTLNLLTAAVIGIGTAAAANAALVTEWDWVVTTEWTTADFSGGGSGGTTFQSPHVLSWGATGGDHHLTGLPSDESRSGIDITPAGPASSPPTAVTNGAFQPTHTFTHYNNTILASFQSLAAATVETTLTLTPAVPPGAAMAPFSTTFDVDFIETFNEAALADCFAGSVSRCDDIFVVRFPGDLTTDFVRDGFLYTVEIGGDLGPLSAAACAEAGAAFPCVGLVTTENAVTDASFAFRISAVAVPVPEPGVLALLGLGLAGLGFASRRRPG